MLEKERLQIDLIDNQIIELLDKRFELTDEIGKIKKANKLEVNQSNREEEIYQKINKVANNKDEIKQIYYEIMKQSKNKQKKL